MKKKLENTFNVLKDNIKGWKIDRDFFIFLACVAIAFAFWSLKTLDKSVVAILEFEVSYQDKPENTSWVKGYEGKKVYVEVEDQGFTIFKYRYLTQFFPLKYRFEPMVDGDDLKQSIPIERVEDQVLNQLYKSTKVLSIHPKVLSVRLEPNLTKKIPVVFSGDVSYEKQYIGDSIILSPDSVEISGTKGQITSIDHVETSHHQYKDLHEDLVRNIAISPVEGVTISPNRVKVQIPVDSYTEEVIELPIRVDSVPDSISFRMIPAIVELRYSHRLEDQFDESSFEIAIDYGNIKPGDSRAPVYILRSPKRTFSLRLEPQVIEFLLEEKASLPLIDDQSMSEEADDSNQE